MPTSWGASPYREQRFDFDATVIRRLEAAGTILAAPTRATVAYPVGVDFDKAFPELAERRPKDFVSPIGSLISAGNLVGFPAISLPNGFGREGLPTALHLLAAPFREDTLVDVGARFQRETDFHLCCPPSASG